MGPLSMRWRASHVVETPCCCLLHPDHTLSTIVAFVARCRSGSALHRHGALRASFQPITTFSARSELAASGTTNVGHSAFKIAWRFFNVCSLQPADLMYRGELIKPTQKATEPIR